MPLLDAHDPHAPGSATRKQVEDIERLAGEKRWPDSLLPYRLRMEYGVESPSDLSLHQASKLVDSMTSRGVMAVVEVTEGPRRDSLGRERCPRCDFLLGPDHEVDGPMCVAWQETGTDYWSRQPEEVVRAEQARMNRVQTSEQSEGDRGGVGSTSDGEGSTPSSAPTEVRS